MVVSNYLIAGTGLSGFICFIKKPSTKVLTNIFENERPKIKKSYKFYEYNKIGGNTNIWGGYINIQRLKKLKKKNKKFSAFIDNNPFFRILKLSPDSKFKHAGFICEKNTKKIFRIKKKFYGKNLINFDIDKIIIRKNFLILKNRKKNIYTKRLNLCVGNLGLLKILYNSKIINNNDIVTFKDADVKYGFNFNLKKNNYYIPMSPFEIIRKFFFDKSIAYNKNNFFSSLIVQIFNNNVKIYRHKISDLLNDRHTNNLRYFTTHHIANLEVNGLTIDKFVRKKTKRIIINCSGRMKGFVAGSISQNIIYNSFTNC